MLPKIIFFILTYRLYYILILVGKNKVEDIELPIFDLRTIVTATKNFAEENMVGEGGFGLVYKVEIYALPKFCNE